MNCASAAQSWRPCGESRDVVGLKPHRTGRRQEGADLLGEASGAQRRVESLGHATTPSSRSWASSSRTTTSCSGPESRRTPRPRSSGTSSSPTSEKPNPWKVQARGAATVRCRRLAIRVAKLAGRTPTEGQGQDALRVGAGLDPRSDGLDQRGGLAGAGPGQHQGGAVAGGRHVVDHGALVLVEHHGSRGHDDHHTIEVGHLSRDASASLPGTQGRQRAVAMSTRSPEKGAPSARSLPTCSARWTSAQEPSARSTRHHGTPEPNRAMAWPTWRAPPRPSAAAMSEYDMTRPAGMAATRSSTSSANGVGSASWATCAP